METIPGNAYSLVKEAPVYMVGFNVYVDPIIDEGIAEKTFDRITEDYTLAKEIDIDGKTHTFKVAMERDQYAARDTVTFSEPTGLLVKRALIRNIINMIATVVMIIVITGTSTVVYRKTKSMHKNTKKAEDNGKK